MNFLSLAGAFLTTFASGFTSFNTNLDYTNVISTSSDGVRTRVEFTDQFDSTYVNNFTTLVSALSSDFMGTRHYCFAVHHVVNNGEVYVSHHSDSTLRDEFSGEIFVNWLDDTILNYDDDSLNPIDYCYSSLYTFTYRKYRDTQSILHFEYSLTRNDFIMFGSNFLSTPTNYDYNNFSYYYLPMDSVSNGYFNSRVNYYQVYYDDIDSGLIFNNPMPVSTSNVDSLYQITNNYLFYKVITDSLGVSFSNYPCSISNISLGNTLYRTNVNYIRDFYSMVYIDYFGGFVYAPFDIQDSSYNRGYNIGFKDGYSAGEDSGYIDGYSAGDTDGYNRGYNIGYSAGVSNTNFQFTNLFGAIADVPVLIVRNLFNFDFFGVNLLSVILSLFTALLILWIARKLL